LEKTFYGATVGAREQEALVTMSRGTACLFFEVGKEISLLSRLLMAVCMSMCAEGRVVMWSCVSDGREERMEAVFEGEWRVSKKSTLLAGWGEDKL